MCVCVCVCACCRGCDSLVLLIHSATQQIFHAKKNKVMQRLQEQARGASRAALHNHVCVLACEFLKATERVHQSKNVCALRADRKNLEILARQFFLGAARLRAEWSEGREIRTPNLLIWSQTRYRCAIPPYDICKS